MSKRNVKRQSIKVAAWLYLTFGWLFIKKPSKLSWTVSDFRKGKRWAMSMPHPYFKNKSLWDYVCTETDSTLILHKLNQFLQ